MNPSKNYIALTEGRMTKSEFLRQARQSFPNLIGAGNSFDDALKILTRRGLINEELIYQNKADKFPLESIERGIRYELEVMDVYDIHHPSQEQYKKARQRAIDNLGKDPLYYINKIAEGIKQPEQEETEGDLKKVEAGTKHTLKEGLFRRKEEEKYTDPIEGCWAIFNDVNHAGYSAPFVDDKTAEKHGYGDFKALIHENPRLASYISHNEDNLAVEAFLNGHLLDYLKKEGLESLVDGWTGELFEGKYITEKYNSPYMKQLAQKFIEWVKSHPHSRSQSDFKHEMAGYNWDGIHLSNGNAILWRHSGYDYIAVARDPDNNSEWEMLPDIPKGLIGTLYDDNKDQNIQEAPVEDNVQLNKKFLDLYIKYKDGNYRVKDKESGELKPGKKLAPETAAQKACLVVRKSMNAPRFRPDRNTIASCAVGRGKLQYQGERDGVPSFNYAWSLKEDDVQEANSYAEISKDPIYTQFYQHYLKKTKEEKDPNAEKTARGKAKKAFVRYNEKKSMKEQQEKAVLKEHIISIIGKVLNEAATANLAQLSDENASVAELPGIINSLENIVTEIESFWIKEQQKIQGVFDQVGNIKNEDGLPVGYKFVQPMLESLKKDLEPVLAKITLDDLKLPEAPAPDQTQVNDPNAQVDPNDPNAVPPVEPKQTVFSPAAKEPLQESKKNKRYTK